MSPTSCTSNCFRIPSPLRPRSSRFEAVVEHNSEDDDDDEEEEEMSDRSSSRRHQGVLYKRRDLFKKRWRPRWFILDDAAVLNYHLLCRDIGSHHEQNAAALTVMTSGVDYDVAPRGTIYLRGCEVEQNDRLSRPSDNLYVFTITPPVDTDSSPCFLAATTPESREEWIQTLARVCGEDDLQQDQESVVTDGSVVPDSDEEVVLWTDLDHSSTVLNSVPRVLADRIQAALAKHLPLLERGDWKPFLEKRGVSAYERKYDGHYIMIKTVAVIPFHPIQVFSLLIDIRRRRGFEPNVRFVERLKRYNAHSFLDYYAYQAVWPTSARDFGVAVHWRVLCRGPDAQEKAICIVAFSDDAADELRPPASDHVRADLKISLYLLRLVVNDGKQCCHVTRILSYDLCGNVPKSLTSTIMQQQAMLPWILTQHLTETEPNPPERADDITNEVIVKEVIEKLSKENEETSKDSVSRGLKFAERGESLMLTDDAASSPLEAVEATDELPFALTAILLLTPLVLWRFADVLNLPGKEAYFVLAALLAVRAVVLSNLGPRFEGSDVPPSVGKVTCRFSVDLKGVLRFIANRKEEQEEEQTESTEVSVIHIVIGVIALAMEEAERLKCKKVSIPLLGINGYYFPRGGGVDISLLVPSSEDLHPDDIYTLEGVESMSVQNIADRIDEEKRRIQEEQQTFGLFSNPIKQLTDLALWMGLAERPMGGCLVIASPDSDHAEVDVDASPLEGSGVNVAVVVGGVRLVRDTNSGASTPVTKGRTSPGVKPPPKPTLSMSITIDCPICNLNASRKFAERVQQLMQFPEMCED